MPAKDTYHDAVKNALIKDNWEITADPYPIKYEEVQLFADLAGEKTFSATREGKQIVIEVKSFLGNSAMYEFQRALGQYLIYRSFLSVEKPDNTVYLAIGQSIYESFFQQRAIKFILQQYQVFLLVVDFKKEEVVEWIS
ncbi:MAG: XisH family protein [Oscillatoria sp. PMC 1051.18]|nr:XisH family protein [Oscillatoria sp. PMC 1050.18]MEC5033015.1 XisH family protein [Oscillatoria sp. PMC 1051.18]